jgi:hypothetical protein
VDTAKRTIFDDARRSTTISWLLVAFIFLASLIFATYPDNDISQTLVQWNSKTQGLLAFSSFLLLLAIFTSRGATAV